MPEVLRDIASSLPTAAVHRAAKNSTFSVRTSQWQTCPLYSGRRYYQKAPKLKPVKETTSENSIGQSKTTAEKPSVQSQAGSSKSGYFAKMKESEQECALIPYNTGAKTDVNAVKTERMNSNVVLAENNNVKKSEPVADSGMNNFCTNPTKAITEEANMKENMDKNLWDGQPCEEVDELPSERSQNKYAFRDEGSRTNRVFDAPAAVKPCAQVGSMGRGTTEEVKTRRAKDDGNADEEKSLLYEENVRRRRAALPDEGFRGKQRNYFGLRKEYRDVEETETGYFPDRYGRRGTSDRRGDLEMRRRPENTRNKERRWSETVRNRRNDFANGSRVHGKSSAHFEARQPVHFPGRKRELRISAENLTEVNVVSGDEPEVPSGTEAYGNEAKSKMEMMVQQPKRLPLIGSQTRRECPACKRAIDLRQWLRNRKPSK